MSKGHGRVQRELLSLLQSNPDGGWPTAELCRHVYGVQDVKKSHRVSLTTSLKKILPRGWRIDEPPGREHFIFNEHSAMSTLLWRCWLRGMTFAQLRDSERIKGMAYDGIGTFVTFTRENAAKDVVKLDDDIRAARTQPDLTTEERVELSLLYSRLQVLKRRMRDDAQKRVGTENDGYYLDGNDWIARRRLDDLMTKLERIRRTAKG